MSTFTLNVFFDYQQRQLLYNAGYNVCIAKLINDKYTVVWSAQTVSNKNVFQWTDDYQVFATTSTFQSGFQVSAQTIAVDITYGKTATVNQVGYMSPARGPQVGNSFTVQNYWMPTHIGVNQKLGGTYQPVYVDPDAIILGDETITPVPSILVFLSRKLTTGSMFTETETVAYQLTYFSTTTQSVSYVTDPYSSGGLSGMWINGAPYFDTFSTTSIDDDSSKAGAASAKDFLAQSVASGQLAAHIPQTYSHERGFKLSPHAYDAFKMAELINFFVNDFKLATDSEESEESKGTKKN